MIYKEKPNVLRVSYGFADEHHDNDESVYLVNVTPAQVLSALTKLKDESPAIEAPKKKDRKPRRTKAEIAAARDAEVDRLNKQNEEDLKDAFGINPKMLGKSEKKEFVWP